MKKILICLLGFLGVVNSLLANETNGTLIPKSSIFVFMDTNYGAVVSRYNLKVEGIEMPQIHGYRFIEFIVPAGKYLIEADRTEIGGTSVNLNVGNGEKHFVFVDPVGFPRPKPILRIVGEVRGREGVGKSVELVVPAQSQANLANKGIQVASSSSLLPTPNLDVPKDRNSEIENLRAELEVAKKKQLELEKLRSDIEAAKTRLVSSEESLTVPPSQVVESGQQIERLSSTINTFANRKALVIGNDSYKSIPKLLAAREDARSIASNLTSVGYQVTLKLDLTEKEMKAALRAFAAQVQGGDEVMFFFAGHGVQLGSANYLLPTDIVGDSEAQVRDEAIQLQRILDDMSEKKAKFTLAMVDACRDNPFKTAGRAIGGRGLAPTTAATGQMVIFSAGTGQQALDRLGNSDTNKNGLFTRVFVQEMQKPNLSIDRVVKNVRNQVAELAKSVGHDQVPAIYDQVLGDFYFKK